MNNVQNDDLEHLQLFTEYGRMALDDEGSGAPFQKLLFLIRDWQFTEISLGAAGGKEVIDEWLKEPSGNQEQEKVRKHIRDCFTEISGFLLPYPGKKVACGGKLNVCAGDMEEDFVQYLNELMPILLAPGNLKIRTVAGNPMKARDLANYLKMYLDLFKGDKIPKPQNILQVTAETNNMVARQEARLQYIKDMESVLGGDRSALSEGDLFRHHIESTHRAETTFKKPQEDGKTGKVSEFNHGELLKEMEEWFKPVERLNKIKLEEERLQGGKV
ncbi:atlastin-2-like [Pollicipes pollicipes]|uniref:atlastin-2-like n=1 Tax=Pollicipes pollicipes TaxID=41117 RepID=UPI0018859DEF|nr:atlastin-2-like [Pollicipes pollicipes]